MTSQLSAQDKILDISVNLARVSDWILSENEQKKQRVYQFLEEIKEYLATCNDSNISPRFSPTLNLFKQEFEMLLNDLKNINKDDWAERALTWANILQHRAKLA